MLLISSDFKNLTTVAGNGQSYPSTVTGPSISSSVPFPLGLAFHPYRPLLFITTATCIYELTLDGYVPDTPPSGASASSSLALYLIASVTTVVSISVGVAIISATGAPLGAAAGASVGENAEN